MSSSDSLGQKEEGFTSKLGILMVGPKRYRKMIDIAGLSPKSVVCAIGPSGHGKTEIPKQAAADREAPYVALHIPTTSVEKFSIPTKADDTKHFYDERIPRLFQPLFDFVEKNQGKIKPGCGPILAFEEINRAKDRSVTNACFTVIESRRIGDVPIPDEIQIVATMNPSGGGMSVNEFERDPAFRRRLLFVGVTANFPEFFQYAKAAKFHKAVLDHLEAQPLWFYREEAARSGKVFPTPASWEKVSNLCKALEASKVDFTSQDARALFAGTIGNEATEAFIDYVGNNLVVITAAEVLKGYRETSVIRDRMRDLITHQRNDAITDLITNVAASIMNGSEREPKTFASQLALFMADLPAETMQAFITKLSTQAKDTDASDYLNKINRQLQTDPQFSVARKRLGDAAARTNEAAKAS